MQLEKKMPSPPWAPVMEERGMVTLYHLNDATSLKVILFFGDDLLLVKHNPNARETKHDVFRNLQNIIRNFWMLYCQLVHGREEQQCTNRSLN